MADLRFLDLRLDFRFGLGDAVTSEAEPETVGASSTFVGASCPVRTPMPSGASEVSATMVSSDVSAAMSETCEGPSETRRGPPQVVGTVAGAVTVRASGKGGDGWWSSL